MIFSALLINCSGDNEHTSMKVMSFNIRYDNPRDGLNAWDNRKEMVVEAITSEKVDIVGMQEVLISQHQYLLENLPEYESYGVGRVDGMTRGELGSIFFKKDRFELLEKSTFWLSQQPDSTGSIGWDAHMARIASWVKLHDNDNNQNLFFFNTHFSHVGPEARENSAKLIISKISKIAGNHPVILSGDFNCTNDSEPYYVITSLKNKTLLFDTHFISKSEHSGGLNTINSFGKSRKEAIIDYLFCNSSFNVNSHAILTIRKDSIYISDHYPVVAILKFTKK